MEQQILKVGYGEVNPEEIIFKLRAIIKFLGEQNGGYELTNSLNNRN